MTHEYGESGGMRIGRGSKYSGGGDLQQCHFVHHKSHVTNIGSNPGSRVRKLATNSLSNGMVRSHTQTNGFAGWKRFKNATLLKRDKLAIKSATSFL
jgi:hypothetical protein